MPIKTREAKTSLLQKGFQLDNRDHIYFRFYYEGKVTRSHTYFSHGTNEIDDSLLSVMKKQLQLDTNQQVRELFDCPLNENDIIEILRRKNLI